MPISKFSVVWSATGTNEKPNDTKISAGWSIAPPEQPPAKWFNWILNAEQTKINALIDLSNVYETELSNVITAGGHTPNLTPGGSGDQVKQAIFDSNALGDSAFGTNISFNHFGPFGDVDLVVGDSSTHIAAGLGTFLFLNAMVRNTATINTNAAGVPLIQVSQRTPIVGGPYEIAKMTPAEIKVFSTLAGTTSATLTRNSLIVADVSPSYSSSVKSEGFKALDTVTGGYAELSLFNRLIISSGSPATVTTQITEKGVKFGGSGNPGDDTPVYRMARFTYAAGVISVVNDTVTGPPVNEADPLPLHYHNYGKAFTTSTGFVSFYPLPITAIILSASIRYKTTGGSVMVCPATLYDIHISGGIHIGCDSFYPSNPAPGLDTGEPVELFITYDASGSF